MNIQNLMKQAQQMQRETQKIQTELESTEYNGTSALVNVVVNGKKDLLRVNINNKEEITCDDIEMLEDMILTAVNDAFKKVNITKILYVKFRLFAPYNRQKSSVWRIRSP